MQDIDGNVREPLIGTNMSSSGVTREPTGSTFVQNKEQLMYEETTVLGCIYAIKIIKVDKTGMETMGSKTVIPSCERLLKPIIIFFLLLAAIVGSEALYKRPFYDYTTSENGI